MSYRIGPDLIERYEDDPHGPLCPHCGWDLERDLCDQCDGEGFIDGERLVEEDPLWYSIDDTERCSECYGKGGWWRCPNDDCPGKQDAP